MSDVVTRAPNAIEVFRSDLAKMEQQFSSALPAHIPVERFMRVVMTAIQNNPNLLKCSRQSLFNACVKAAQDGLLPDGREGAIVPFDSEKGGDTASWLPMIQGLRKKARNSGELSDWFAEVVHEGDEFEYQKGDNPFIFHRPAKKGGRTRPVTHAYSIAIYKDGTKSREVMNIDEIEEVRQRFSKARKGPWHDPVLYPEMCRKTVARLHAKQLPMSTDLDTLIRRDDDLYDFKEARERSGDIARPNMANALDYFAGQIPPPADDAPAIENKTETVVIHKDAATGPTVSAINVPKNAEQYREFFDGVMAHAQGSGQTADLLAWFSSDGQRRLRNACGVVNEQTTEMRAELVKIAEASK
jgi:recombination protein RecT